jgi:hypothetical protein
MSFDQHLQRAQQDIALIALHAEVAAFLHQTRAIVLIRTGEAQLRADGLQVPVSERLSQAHIQYVKRELATAKTRAVALITELEQAPALLSRGNADALAALQALSADLDALANFPELPQAPSPENPPKSDDILPATTPEDPQQLG